MAAKFHRTRPRFRTVGALSLAVFAVSGLVATPPSKSDSESSSAVKAA